MFDSIKIIMTSNTNDKEEKVIRIWTEFGSTCEIDDRVDNFVKKNYVNISHYFWVYAGQAEKNLVL